MNTPTKVHILLSGSLAAGSVIALVFGLTGLLSGGILILTNLYLILMLIEAASKAETKHKTQAQIPSPKPAYFFSFPTKIWTGTLIFLISIATICGFANMYIDSAEIVYVGPQIDRVVTNNSNVEPITKISIPAPSILKTKTEAIYFSLVTMITLGYGDYLPASTATRLLVIWQLFTGALLALGIFPLIVSRVANF